MLDVSSIKWDVLRLKRIYYNKEKTKTIDIRSLMSYINAGTVTRDKKDILTDILEFCGLIVSEVSASGSDNIVFSTGSYGGNTFLKFTLNNITIKCRVNPHNGKVYFKPAESASSSVKTIEISNSSVTLTSDNAGYSLGYVVVCMDEYSAYHNMREGINPLDWAQNRVLRDIDNLPNDTTSLTNNSSVLAWTSLGKYYINNQQVQYFSVPTVAKEVQWGNQLDNKGGWFIFDEKQNFGLAKQSEPKNFALVDFTEIPDQIIFENFSNNTSPKITWVDDKTIKINDSSFYIGEKGKVMVVRRGSAVIRQVSHELEKCSFGSSWGLLKKNRTMFSYITTKWNWQSGETAPSRPDSKKVNVSLSAFPLQQGQLVKNQTSLSDITYSTISNHRFLTTISDTQEIDGNLSLPVRSSSLRPDGYVPQDPTFYVFVGGTATATSTGGMHGGGSSKTYASAYLKLKIQVTNLPVLIGQDTWLLASIGKLFSYEHGMNQEISHSGDYEHYLSYIWDLSLNAGLLGEDIDIYGEKADTIQYRTWLGTAYMYFPSISGTQHVFQETKGTSDYTSSVYCGLGFSNRSDDYAYCIYITYSE